MRILYHHRTQGKGVEGVHIRELVRAFQTLGHKADVVSPPGVSIWEEQKGGTSFLGKIWARMSRWVPEVIFEVMEIVYNATAAASLKRAMQTTPVDLIYERYAIFLWATVRLAKRRGIPIILEVNYTAQTPLYRKRSSLLKPLAVRIDRYLFGAVNGIVVVSTFLKEHLIKDYHVPEERLVVLTNAVDPEVFSSRVDPASLRRKFGLDGKNVIGFVGGFYPWHGLDILLDALPLIAQRVKNAALLLVGDGPERPRLTERARQGNCGIHVVFVGGVSHANLPPYIAAFDMAVLPDSNEYGSPMKIYEYMSMGKPVVAPKLGPVEDGIIHDKVGLLFSPRDVSAFAAKIISLLENPERRKRMGQAAREHIVCNHTWKRNAEQILELLGRNKVTETLTSKSEGVTYEVA